VGKTTPTPPPLINHPVFVSFCLDTIYLDNAGAAIPSEKQMRAFHDELVRVTYANPHSGGMASRNTTNEVNNVRERILRHFSASKKEYAVIFTSGTTKRRGKRDEYLIYLFYCRRYKFN
jgi:selenocysteine lyase/cysteine desulfurase